jgi:hypothetical protein
MSDTKITRKRFPLFYVVIGWPVPSAGSNGRDPKPEIGQDTVDHSHPDGFLTPGSSAAERKAGRFSETAPAILNQYVSAHLPVNKAFTAE